MSQLRISYKESPFGRFALDRSSDRLIHPSKCGWRWEFTGWTLPFSCVCTGYPSRTSWDPLCVDAKEREREVSSQRGRAEEKRINTRATEGSLYACCVRGYCVSLSVWNERQTVNSASSPASFLLVSTHFHLVPFLFNLSTAALFSFNPSRRVPTGWQSQNIRTRAEWHFQEILKRWPV